MASIVKLDTGWRALVTVNKVRKTKVFKGKREAQQWAMITEAEMRDTKCRQLKTFAEVLERYRDEVSPTKVTKKWEEIRIDAFLRDPFLPTHLDIGEVTADHLGIWRNERLKKVSPGTVIREFTIISNAFNIARKEWKYITVNPASDVRRPKQPMHREVLITLSQIKRVLKASGYSPRKPITTVSESVAVAFLIALRSGMRAGEICNLKWSQYQGDELKKVGSKTEAAVRDVPVMPNLERLLLKMKGWDGDKVLNLEPSTLDALFRKLKKKAKVSGFTFHDSRHNAATEWAKHVDVLTLCKIFGWKNTKQALTYYNPTASSIVHRRKQSINLKNRDHS